MNSYHFIQKISKREILIQKSGNLACWPYWILSFTLFYIEYIIT